MSLPYLSIATLTPLLAALVVMALPAGAVRAIRGVAAAATLVSMVVSGWLFREVWLRPAAPGFRWVEELPWLPDLGIQYKMGADGLSIGLFFLTGIVCFAAMLISFQIEQRQREYFALALVAVSGVLGVFATLDLFFLILFYEMASIPMFFLVGIWGSDRVGMRTITRQQAALKLLLYLQLGGGLVLLGILWLYFASGAQSFDYMKLQQAVIASDTQYWIFVLILLGFGIEAGLVPFHTWLPDGHSCAPTAMSMLLSGLLVKMGGYGIIRLGVALLPEGAQDAFGFFALLAVANLLYGALCALRTTDIKVMIAYSSVSHMGIVFLGISCLGALPQTTGREFGLTGAIFQMFAHGVATALLFALAGSVYHLTHTRDMTAWGGLAARLPWFATFYVLAALASLGLPGLSGFVAELMVFLGTWQYQSWLAVLAAPSLVITATYLLRSVQFAFLGPLNPRYADLPDAHPVERLAFILLAVAILALGLLPGLLTDVTFPYVRDLIGRLG
ncbi:MAG TPA: NADH-quinone oxidoreductase subunit M [Candidatus Nitrosotenuis sp.]|jgi:NADH-quinone oxidoreductase subunit M|nr:NADH-quinone oxidoreductase subunit M [Candidatus Nitrosotenuis sp.]